MKADYLERQLDELQNTVKDLQLHCLRVQVMGDGLEKVQKETKELRTSLENITLKLDGLSNSELRKQLQIDTLLTQNYRRSSVALCSPRMTADDSDSDPQASSADKSQDGDGLRSFIADLQMRVEALERRDIIGHHRRGVSAVPSVSRLVCKDDSEGNRLVERTSKQSDRSSYRTSLVSIKKDNDRKKSQKKSVRSAEFPSVIVQEQELALHSPMASDVEAVVLEHRWVLSEAFNEFLDHIQTLQHVTPHEVEDFLTGLKGEDALSAEMMQELMLILSSKQGVCINTIDSIIAAMESSPSFNPSTVTQLLTFLSHSSFSVGALAAVLKGMTRPGSTLTPSVLQEILELMVKATKLTPAGMTKWLKFLTKFDGLIPLLRKIMQLRIWRVESLESVLDVLTNAKVTTLNELILLMKASPMEQLLEMIHMLFQIPGYANELLLSLPASASHDLIVLVEHLFSGSRDGPFLLQGIIETLAESPQLSSTFLELATEYLSLIQSYDGVSGDSVLQLFELIRETKLDIDMVNDFLMVIQGPEFSMDALHDFIQAARTTPIPLCAAIPEFLGALVASSTKPESLFRMFKLLEKSVHVTPESLGTLLRLMEKTGLLRKAAFVEVSTVAGTCQFGQVGHAIELLEALKTQDFLTLEDLCRCLQKMHFVTMRDLEERMRCMSEIHAQQLRVMIAKYDDMSGSRVSVESLELERLSDNVAQLRGTIRQLQDRQEALMKVVGFADAHSETDNLGELPPGTGSQHDISNISKAPTKQSSQRTSGAILNIRGELEDLKSIIFSVQEDCEGHSELMDDLTQAIQKLQAEKVARDELKELYAQLGLNSESASQLGLTQSSKRDSHSRSGSGVSRSRTPLDNAAKQEDVRARSGSVHFSATCRRLLHEQMGEDHPRLDEVSGRLLHHEATCFQTIQRLIELLSLKTDRMELQDFKQAVTRQLHIMATRTPPLDAAVSKRFLKGVCLSCDKKVVYDTEPPAVSTMFGGLPPIKPDRPHTVFQTDVVRQHARSLREPHVVDRLDVFTGSRQCGGPYSFAEIFQRTQAWTSMADLPLQLILSRPAKSREHRWYTPEE